MNKKRIVFFTTNSIWGGSEILWTQAAAKLKQLNFHVSAVANYDFQQVRKFLIDEIFFFDLSNRFKNLPLWKSAFNKIGLSHFKPIDLLEKFLSDTKPDLAIISQGNNMEGAPFMEICNKKKIPFVTITHLVVEGNWPGMNDESICSLQSLFDRSLINFFVSKFVLQMHEKFIGYKAQNSRVIYNPFIKNTVANINYPPVENGQYKVALLGRLEVFHKGYDLLIEVVRQEKWQSRNIQFTIFGNGPHLKLIRRLVEINRIKNIEIKSHSENISDVWSENHLLIMPSRLEGQSLTLIEAMNFKRVVVATRVGGVEELLEDEISGFIAEFPAVSAIDDALERAWNRRTEWEQLGINAYNSIKAKHPADAVGYFINELKPYLT